MRKQERVPKRSNRLSIVMPVTGLDPGIVAGIHGFLAEPQQAGRRWPKPGHDSQEIANLIGIRGTIDLLRKAGNGREDRDEQFHRKFVDARNIAARGIHHSGIRGSKHLRHEPQSGGRAGAGQGRRA